MHRGLYCVGQAQRRFYELRVYKACFFRLVLFPALFFVILILFTRLIWRFVSLTIQASAPAAAVTSIFASKCGRDAALASKIVAISTLLFYLNDAGVYLAGYYLLYISAQDCYRAAAWNFGVFCEQKQCGRNAPSGIV